MATRVFQKPQLLKVSKVKAVHTHGPSSCTEPVCHILTLLKISHFAIMK